VSLLDKVRAALGERDVSLDCASCGQRSWKGGWGELGNLYGLLPGVTPDGVIMETPVARGGLAVYPLICSNCGYIRLYSLEVLVGDDR